MSTTTRWHRTAVRHCLARETPAHYLEYLMVDVDGWWHYGLGIMAAPTSGPHCSLEVAKRAARRTTASANGARPEERKP